MRPVADRRTIDVWMSTHHVGLDGVPLQDLLTELEQAWGVSQPPVFPAPDLHRPFMAPRLCSCPGERDVHEMLMFVDLSPVLALGDQLNSRHASEVGEPVTRSTAFMRDNRRNGYLAFLVYALLAFIAVWFSLAVAIVTRSTLVN